MFTTIEPRLIALLNDEPSESTSPPSLSLPPLHDPNIVKASCRPSPLEPHTSARSGESTSSHPHTHPPFLPHDTDSHSHSNNSPSHPHNSKPSRSLGPSSPQSLRKILSDDNTNTSNPNPNNRNLPSSSSTASSPKKRRIDPNPDDFVQLPQPKPKKPRSNKQVVPPIIIGLFEPPPQATLFPPISSSAFHDSHGRNTLNSEVAPVPRDETSPETFEVGAEIPASVVVPERKEKGKGKVEKKTSGTKIRKKWSDEETNNLLLGVHKHGVGKWTDILEDEEFKPSFEVNGRSAVDLKDRFRTCCPDELRGGTKKNRAHLNGMINMERDSQIQSETAHQQGEKPRKPRHHRKHLTDLLDLGINIQGSTPFQPSSRRERKPFTKQDDREILEGYAVYGPQWSRIRRDARWKLAERQPTDLRDRWRNLNRSGAVCGKGKDNDGDKDGKEEVVKGVGEKPGGDEETVENGNVSKEGNDNKERNGNGDEEKEKWSESRERLKIHQMIEVEEGSASTSASTNPKTKACISTNMTSKSKTQGRSSTSASTSQVAAPSQNRRKSTTSPRSLISPQREQPQQGPNSSWRIRSNVQSQKHSLQFPQVSNPTAETAQRPQPPPPRATDNPSAPPPLSVLPPIPPSTAVPPIPFSTAAPSTFTSTVPLPPPFPTSTSASSLGTTTTTTTTITNEINMVSVEPFDWTNLNLGLNFGTNLNLGILGEMDILRFLE